MTRPIDERDDVDFRPQDEKTSEHLVASIAFVIGCSAPDLDTYRSPVCKTQLASRKIQMER